MIEDAVQNDTHPQLLCIGDQRIQIFLCPQIGIDRKVIARVVAMIGKGLKDGIEIDDGYTKRFEISELFADPFQVSAEKVIVQDFPLSVRTKIGLLSPIPHDTMLDRLIPVTVKPIRKDLVHDPALEPIGGRVMLVIDGELPTDRIAPEGNALVHRSASDIASADRKMVKVEPVLVESQRDRPTKIRAGHLVIMASLPIPP